ncbi:MAG: magnesium transporter [Flavobacteriales bacterium AspAUS03]
MVKVFDSLKIELKEALNQGRLVQLREDLNNQNISDLVELIQAYSEGATAIVGVLEIHRAASVFKILDFPLQKELVKNLPAAKVAELLNELPVDDRVAFLEELPEYSVKEMVKYLRPEEKRQTLVSMGYPEDSVGRLMIPNYIAVRDTWRVEHVLDYIRREGKNSDTIEVVYIVNEQGQLVDDVRIREFLLVDPSTEMTELMDWRYISLSVTDSEEEATKIFNMNNRVTLPVVDDQNILLGVVTIDDILWVANENYSEDIQKIGGMEALDQAYLDVPLPSLIKKRAGWLIVLFLGEMFTTTAMQHFSNSIEKAVVLSLFIPLVVSSGGNSGSQAASLIIQAMALGDVRLKDWWRVMRREIICGLSLGGILGFIGFIRITTWQSIQLYDYGSHWVLVALSVSFSLVGIVLWGTLSGSMLPILIKRLGGDPASSSAPFVATLVDVTGIVIYFSIAYLFLNGILL